ncbi:hypothetical protein PG988_010332 [Apiospora saccharicola]
MAATIRYLFPKNPSSFLWHRPGAFDRAYGKTWGSGIDLAHLPSDRAEISASMKYIVDHPEAEAAWADYCHDFLLDLKRPDNMAFPFPPFYLVEGFLHFLLDHEALVDFLHFGGKDKQDKEQWNQIAHVAAFILRMQRQRMVDEKLHRLEPWGTAHHWCAAHVLWELLHWKHTEWQRQYIAEHQGSPTLDQPTLAMHAAVAPGTGLQSYAPRSAWANLKAILFRTVQRDEKVKVKEETVDEAQKAVFDSLW